MLTLLLITSLFSVGYTNKCPDGTQQLGSGGAVGAYQSGRSKTGVTVEDCKYYCLEMGARNCKSFSFDKKDVDNGVLSLCIPYQLDTISGIISNNPRSDQVLCAMEMCPLGTAQIGPDGSVGTKQVAALRTGYTIEQCRDYCRKALDCESFLYDDNYRNNSGYSDLEYSSCILYGEDDVAGVLPDTHTNADALLCALYDSDTVICPADTTQIATTGSFFYAPMVRYYTGFSKEVCRNACHYYRDCTAFAYDSDTFQMLQENVTPSLCRLFNVNRDTRIGQYTRIDTILCATRIFFAQAPNVFSFDVNGKVTQISGNYVIYIIGFVGIMVVINAICVMMYCWNKLKRNKVNYKLVSMRSDAETDVEHQ